MRATDQWENPRLLVRKTKITKILSADLGSPEFIPGTLGQFLLRILIHKFCGSCMALKNTPRCQLEPPPHVPPQPPPLLESDSVCTCGCTADTRSTPGDTRSPWRASPSQTQESFWSTPSSTLWSRTTWKRKCWSLDRKSEVSGQFWCKVYQNHPGVRWAVPCDPEQPESGSAGVKTGSPGIGHRKNCPFWSTDYLWMLDPELVSLLSVFSPCSFWVFEVLKICWVFFELMLQVFGCVANEWLWSSAILSLVSEF